MCAAFFYISNSTLFENAGVQKSTKCIFAIIRYLAAFGSVGALIIALPIYPGNFCFDN